MNIGCPAWWWLTLALAPAGWAAAPAEFKLVGDWEVAVAVNEPRALRITIRVPPPILVRVTAERYAGVPVFNPNAGGWLKGAQLHGVQAQETTTPGLLDAESFILRAGPEAGAMVFQQGEDYEIDLVWGTFGRTTNSLIQPDQVVFASYRHAQHRPGLWADWRDGD